MRNLPRRPRLIYGNRLRSMTDDDRHPAIRVKKAREGYWYLTFRDAPWPSRELFRTLPEAGDYARKIASRQRQAAKGNAWR